MIGCNFRATALAIAALSLTSIPAYAQLTLGSPAAAVALHVFSGTDGANPNGPLLIGSDGAFYGVSFAGGAQKAGVVYRVTTAGVETVLHSFGASGDGANPSGALVQTSNGTIYGATIHGGANNSGTIYSISPAGAYSTIYSFTGSADGSQPYSGLTLGGNTLYGATFLGGSGSGTLFSCTTAGSLTTMYTFSALAAGGANPDGAMPYGAPVLGSDGALYGATTVGGANGNGVLYRITTAGVFSVLHTFAALGASGVGSEGANSFASLYSASDSNLYGTTYSGGANGTGAIFRVSTSGTYATLYSFSALNAGSDNTDGANPSSALIQGTDGNLYGVAGYGGANGSGTLFSESPAGSFTSVCSFAALASGNTAAGAARPYGSVVQSAGGTFYLSGYYGGSAASGSIVSIVQYTFPAGLQLFSVPFDYTGTPLSGVLSTTSPLVADWVSSTSQYAETPTTPADTLHQGNAYWARFAAPVSVTACANDLAAGQSSFSIPLASGWNMVGDPFQAAVPISSLVVIDARNQTHAWADAAAKNLILPTFYSYDPSSNTYVAHTTDSLEPYTGYWLQALQGVTLQAPRP